MYKFGEPAPIRDSLLLQVRLCTLSPFADFKADGDVQPQALLKHDTPSLTRKKFKTPKQGVAKHALSRSEGVALLASSWINDGIQAVASLRCCASMVHLLNVQLSDHVH